MSASMCSGTDVGSASTFSSRVTCWTTPPCFAPGDSPTKTTLNVEALPMEVPESIDADVSGMQMGDTLRLEDLVAPEGATFLDDPHETVIATVSAPAAEIEEEPVEGEEGEEAAEGEEPTDEAGEAAEGEAASGDDGEPGTTEG
jgi:hypothetical protein